MRRLGSVLLPVVMVMAACSGDPAAPDAGSATSAANPANPQEGTTSTAAPIATTTTAPSLAGATAGVCRGTPVEDAAAFAGAAPARMVLSGTDTDWRTAVPADWVAESISETELVVCIDESLEELEKCRYMVPQQPGRFFTVTRQRVDWSVEVREAQTARVVDATELTGSVPRACGAEESTSLTYLTGEPPLTNLLGWMEGISPSAWAPLPPPGSPGDPPHLMRAVVAGGPGYVAVGKAGGGFGNAAAWTSEDGLRWTRVPDDAAAFRGMMVDVAAGGPGFVAVGYEVTYNKDAAVWTSPDGVTWIRTPHDEEVFGAEWTAEMLAVAAGGDRLVAVGFDDPSNKMGDEDAAVWTSTDGIDWARSPLAETADDDLAQTMNDVLAVGAGFVAVGSVGGRAAVWTSPDGLAWTRVPDDGTLFGEELGHQIAHVAEGGPGLVAVGYAYAGDDLDAAVWTSPDGFTWQRAPHDEAVFGGPGNQSMQSVAAVASGLVAVGSDQSGDGSAAVWTSPDGIVWTRLDANDYAFGEASISDVIARGTGVIAVGSREDEATVWYSGEGF